MLVINNHGMEMCERCVKVHVTKIRKKVIEECKSFDSLFAEASSLLYVLYTKCAYVNISLKGASFYLEPTKICDDWNING